jgi:2-polyprenyl-3-methyl-5-hydroxy-6-metoxy-1,4-benzoquinol methylase
MLSTWKEHYWYTVTCTRVRIEEIVKRAKGAYTVLDCGCNEGFLSKALLEAGFHVTSIDNDEATIAKAKEMFGINAIKADVNDLPYLDNEFDLVIGGEILEHLDNPGRGLAEMLRVAKGRVIISMPIGEYWLGEQTHK